MMPASQQFSGFAPYRQRQAQVCGSAARLMAAVSSHLWGVPSRFPSFRFWDR